MEKEKEESQYYCYCISCGEEIPEDECTFFEDNCYCDDCLENRTFVCERCAERFLNDENAGNDVIQVCQRCYEYYYTTCDHCGCIITQDDACYEDGENGDYDRHYCNSCYEIQISSRVIHKYNYKPSPVFYGNGPRFMGVELEVDCGGESSKSAIELCDIANADNERIYIKHDGSLTEGFEIVTHPMSLDYHRNNMPWKPLAKRALELGYLSHKTDTCGLHVHVNRNSLSENYVTQKYKLSKILYIIERFWSEMLLFSRRTEAQIAQWAQRYGYEETPKHIFDKAQESGNRYRCVNLENEDTFEFRIFRGTLSYNTIIATLEMVDFICDISAMMYDYELTQVAWSDFTGKINTDKYPELIAYLKERRLYIEPLRQ